MPNRGLVGGHRHDDNSVMRPIVTELSGKLRELMRSVPLARILEGGAIGVALWCILFILQLLPGAAADIPEVLLFGIAGLVVRVTRFHRGLLVILAIAAAVVVVVTQTSVSNIVASHWIREDQFPDSAVDAVVVLSAGLNPNATISGEALDDLITGLELVGPGKARILVTTTVEQQFPNGLVTSTLDQSRIVALPSCLLRIRSGRLQGDLLSGTSSISRRQGSWGVAGLPPQGVRGLGVRSGWYDEVSRERLAKISAARATKSRAIAVAGRKRCEPDRAGFKHCCRHATHAAHGLLVLARNELFLAA
jgi:hypothetical protein